jgi:adenylyltransferase/sulfurtransferase
VRVKYFATFRDLAGEQERQVDSTPTDMGELLRLLSDRYGPAFRNAVFEGDALHRELILLVNGRNVRLSGGLDTPLHPADEISVFPMVAGG